MIIPEKSFLAFPTPRPDFSVTASPQLAKYNMNKVLPLWEGETIIYLDETSYYLSEVNAVYLDKHQLPRWIATEKCFTRKDKEGSSRLAFGRLGTSGKEQTLAREWLHHRFPVILTFGSGSVTFPSALNTKIC